MNSITPEQISTVVACCPGCTRLVAKGLLEAAHGLHARAVKAWATTHPGWPVLGLINVQPASLECSE